MLFLYYFFGIFSVHLCTLTPTTTITTTATTTTASPSPLPEDVIRHIYSFSSNVDLFQGAQASKEFTALLLGDSTKQFITRHEWIRNVCPRIEMNYDSIKMKMTNPSSLCLFHLQSLVSIREIHLLFTSQESLNAVLFFFPHFLQIKWSSLTTIFFPTHEYVYSHVTRIESKTIQATMLGKSSRITDLVWHFGATQADENELDRLTQETRVISLPRLTLQFPPYQLERGEAMTKLFSLLQKRHVIIPHVSIIGLHPLNFPFLSFYFMDPVVLSRSYSFVARGMDSEMVAAFSRFIENPAISLDSLELQLAPQVPLTFITESLRKRNEAIQASSSLSSLIIQADSIQELVLYLNEWIQQATGFPKRIVLKQFQQNAQVDHLVEELIAHSQGKVEILYKIMKHSEHVRTSVFLRGYQSMLDKVQPSTPVASKLILTGKLEEEDVLLFPPLLSHPHCPWDSLDLRQVIMSPTTMTHLLQLINTEITKGTWTKGKELLLNTQAHHPPLLQALSLLLRNKNNKHLFPLLTSYSEIQQDSLLAHYFDSWCSRFNEEQDPNVLEKLRWLVKHSMTDFADRSLPRSMNSYATLLAHPLSGSGIRINVADEDHIDLFILIVQKNPRNKKFHGVISLYSPFLMKWVDSVLRKPDAFFESITLRDEGCEHQNELVHHPMIYKVDLKYFC